jgi:hypothetical protein
MRRQDFIANPRNVAKGENSNGFRAVAAAGSITENPMSPIEGVGGNVNGDWWRAFPRDFDATPKMCGPSKRLGRGR